MNKIWLKNYPPACRRRSIRTNIPRCTALLETSCERFADLPRVHQHGPHDHLRASTSALRARLRGLAAAERGPAEGRSHRAHAAERPAVPDRAVRRAARRARPSSTPIRSTPRASSNISWSIPARKRSSSSRTSRTRSRDVIERHQRRARHRHRRRRPARLAEVGDRESGRAARAQAGAALGAAGRDCASTTCSSRATSCRFDAGRR